MTEEQIEAIRERAKRPDVRLKHSIVSRKYYSDQENRDKLSEQLKKTYLEHPEYGKNRSEKLKAYYSNPENRLKCKARISRYKDDPEYRKKLSEGVKRAWANKTPEEREKIKSKCADTNRKEDVRAKNSISNRKRRMRTREETLRKTSDPCERAIKNRAKMDKFYEERDKYYIMTKLMDNSRTYGLITEAEAFIRFLTKRI